MSQADGKGKGKAEGPSSGQTSSQNPPSTSSTSSYNQLSNSTTTTSSSSAKAHHANPTSFPSAGNAGVRAGGIAAELAAMMRSSGKAGSTASASAAGSSAQLLADSALSDALQGAGAGAGGGAAVGGPGAGFRRAAAREEESASLSSAAGMEFDQFASGSASAAGVGAGGATYAQQQHHPMLRPGQPLSPRLAAYSEALRGPWSSASDLDGELHAQARRESLISPIGADYEQPQSSAWVNEFAEGAASGYGPGVDEAAMEEAWRAYTREVEVGVDDFKVGNGEEQARMLDPDFHAEWARTVPAPTFGAAEWATAGGQEVSGPSGSTGDAGEADFFATLEAEERAEEALSRQRGPPVVARPVPAAVNGVFSADSQAADLAQLGIDASRLPSGITTEWRPPSPSGPSSVSIEQLLLHQALAAKQEASESDDADRARERIRPADDDEREGQGVFASTPEDALRSVWDGKAEAERVRRDKEKRLVDLAERIRRGESLEETERDVDRLIADVKRWFPRGTYAEEVHGVPPLLAQTLADAELPAEETDPELVERRLAAIRRLEAMRSHLQSSTRRSPAG
ncbi:unnamed protein product [Tilletia controversa]|uniref:Uncharacterized protein n=3 Tax=Tilletia TaxID=13289 RepID=A0A8X7MVV6_9BASI|nr:hypothetical protein CF336_g36 [Tilletia laevis]KAE8203457.1 hypothetical protein CF328_g1649 [Tilletia controversa]KAE8264689.1 hypothetical protein A4X03_0g773 [Tilletia caries]KAE8205971.1 hypothetical protein CF335_g2125 [Tilletia laevis]KAE8249566.1 hypothetical protein A4X06_0g3170 [Tilletia controversa]